MRSQPLRSICAFVVAVTLSAGFLAGRLQAAEAKADARSITISEPVTSEVNSNLHQLGTKKDGLKQLEDDLFKPLKKTFSPKGSLDGVLVPPQARSPGRNAVPQTKKEKEQEAEKREWVFLSPEELASGPSMAEIFNIPEYGPDGMEKKKLTPMERYYESLERKGKGETNSSNKGREPDRYIAPSQPGSKDEMELSQRGGQPKKDEESLDRVQKLFTARSDDNSLAGAEHHGTISDIFGLGENKPSAEWTKAQKGRLDEFKQLIGFSSTPSASGSDPFALAHGMSGPSPKIANPFGGLDGSSGSRSSSLDSQWGKINPISAPAGLPDFNSKGFGSWGFTPPPVKSEPVNLAPSLPNFNTTKRSF